MTFPSRSILDTEAQIDALREDLHALMDEQEEAIEDDNIGYAEELEFQIGNLMDEIDELEENLWRKGFLELRSR